MVPPSLARLARLAALSLGFAIALSAPAAEATHDTDTDELYAVQSRISTPNFQLFLNLADEGSVTSSPPLFGPGFGPIGGVYSADFMGDTMYGTELDNSNLTDYYLVTIEHEGAMRGVATRVGAVALTAPAVEGLTVAEGVIYGSSLSFGAHLTALITIDETTGIDSLIGTASRNVMIVALAYDPVEQVMYGAGIPFGAGEGNAVNVHNLYMIDMTTGGETLIGPLGVPIQGMTWDKDLGLVGAYEKLYAIDASTGAATQIGTADFADGMPGTFNGIYAIGAHLPDGIGPPTCTCGDPVVDGGLGASGASSGGLVTASDALFILAAAVGLQSCELCACDVDDSGGIAATDALIVLGAAVGLPNELSCPAS